MISNVLYKIAVPIFARFDLGLAFFVFLSFNGYANGEYVLQGGEAHIKSGISYNPNSICLFQLSVYI